MLLLNECSFQKGIGVKFKVVAIVVLCFVVTTCYPQGIGIGVGTHTDGSSSGIGTGSTSSSGGGSSIGTGGKGSGTGGSSIGQQQNQPPTPTTFIFLSSYPAYTKGWAAYTAALNAGGPGVTIGQKPGTVLTYAPIAQSVMDNFKNALGSFANLYADPTIHQKIDGNDGTNLVVQVIKSMSDAFTGNLNALKQVIDQQLNLGKEFASLVDQMEQQAKAYNDIMASLQGYVQSNWNALYAAYTEEVSIILFFTYADIFSHYAKGAASLIDDTVMALIEKYFASAKAVYPQFSKDVKAQIPAEFTSADQAMQAVQSEVSLIAFNGFNNALGAMEPEETVQTLTDLIGPNNNNRKILQKAVVYLQTAHDASDAELYATQISSLMGALQGFDKALSAGTFDQQIANLNASGGIVSLLSAGFALWLSQHIRDVADLLAAQFFAQSAPKVFDPLTQYYKRLSALEDVINTIDIQTSDNLSDFFSALASVDVTNYENAIQYYGDASKTSLASKPSLTSAQIALVQKGQLLYPEALDEILINLQTGSSSLASALKNLKGTPGLSDMQEAHQQVLTALTSFAAADNGYIAWQANAGAQASTILPLYQAVPDQSFSTFVAQYMIHYYRVLAAPLQSDDSKQALFDQYYVYANALATQTPYQVSPEVKNQISSLIQSRPSVITTASKSLQKAQGSDAIQDWQSALSATLAVYTAWASGNQDPHFEDGPGLYLECLQCFINSKNLAAFQDQNITKVLLLYRLYLLVSASSNIKSNAAATCYSSQDPETILKDITALIKPFLDDGAQNVTAASSPKLDPNTGYATSLQALNNLYSWQTQAESLVDGCQQALSDQKAATPSQSGKALLERTGTQGSCVTSYDAVTYDSPLIAGSSPVQLDNVALTLAQLNEKQAEWAVQQAALDKPATLNSGDTCMLNTGFHGIAWAAYGEAQNYYNLACQSDKAAQMGQMNAAELVLLNADLHGNFIIPVAPDTSVFSPFLLNTSTAYARYFMSPCLMPIPNVPLVPTTIFTNKTAILDLAAALYLYQHLTAAGQSLEDYLIPVQNKNYSTTDDTQAKIIKDAQAYRDQLTQWTTTGFTLPSGQTVKTSLEYYAPDPATQMLVYCNLPILPLPAQTDAKQALDPTASTEYGSAIPSYTSFIAAHSDNTLFATQVAYAKDRVDALKKALAQTYLSEAYMIFMKANYMIGQKVDQSLITLVTIDAQEQQALESAKTQLATLLSTKPTVTQLPTDPNHPLIQAINFVLIIIF